MYDTQASLAAINAHAGGIMLCLSVAIICSFIYFFMAFYIAIKQRVYVVPYIGAALFFCHDLTFVLLYHKWFATYDSWWLKMWCFALIGTVILEAVMIYQVYLYGHKELWPNLSKRAFGLLLVLGVVGIGAMWALVKVALNDELFFVSFAVTASFSIPFHTGIMARRQSRAGQSVVMELCTIFILLALTGVFSQVSPFFRSPAYFAFVVAFSLWPLVNIWLMFKLPAAPATIAVKATLPNNARLSGTYT
jgi:hypothetical protein